MPDADAPKEPVEVSANVSVLDTGKAPVTESPGGPPIIPESVISFESTTISSPVTETASAPAVDVPKGECNCQVKVKGRGRHAMTCPRFTPNKPVAPASPSTVAELLQPTAAGVQVDYNLMAAAVFDMSAGALAMGLGPEWMPRKPASDKEPDERAMVVSSLAKYFESRKVEDIPPGLMLTLVISIYALPRITQPSTKSKLIAAWLWCKDKLFRKKTKLVVV